MIEFIINNNEIFFLLVGSQHKDEIESLKEEIYIFSQISFGLDERLKQYPAAMQKKAQEKATLWAQDRGKVLNSKLRNNNKKN